MERKYSKKHLWVEFDGNEATIGITDFLQEKLGDIMFVNLPEPGEQVKIDERFGDIESKKTVMDMESIVSGEVLKINEDVLDEPYLINEAPDDSWLIKVKVDEVSDSLLDEETYTKHISQPWMQSHKE